MNTLWIVLGVVFVGLYALYFSLILKRNKLKEALSGIDVQLKKRYDLIPNILEMAAKFMKHERALMEEITKLRTDAMSKDFAKDGAAKSKIENLLDQKLSELKIAVENYPDLKSNQTMVQAMETFNDVEEHIAASRRFYNSAVNDLKNACEIFPSNIVAKIFGIKGDLLPFFEAEAEAKERINAKDFFK